MYVVSPLGNLNDLVDRLSPFGDWGYSIVNVLPDFISKRVAPGFDPTTPLTVPYFNVSTGWASAWKFNGYGGLWFTFLVLLAVLAAGIVLVRTSLHLVTWALLCGVTAFTFFTNALSYSGVSFALTHPILARRAPRTNIDHFAGATRAEAVGIGAVARLGGRPLRAIIGSHRTRRRNADGAAGDHQTLWR